MYSDALTTTSGAIEFSFYLIVWTSVVLLGGITAAMIFLTIRFSRKRNPVPRHIEGSFWLEILWTVIPVGLVMVMFYYGWIGYDVARKAPRDAMVVKVTAQMWSWLFEYENGKRDVDLYVPVNKPVKLILTSRDVLHSFFVAAFRMKEDCVPGRENTMWFQATRVDDYDIQCAEYCGTSHSAMLAKLHVLSEEDFNKWYTTITPFEELGGFRMLQLKGCLSCHSTDGSKGIGPSLGGLFGRKEIIRVRGEEMAVTADEDYIRESILNPDLKIVKGYSPGKMPGQEGLITDEELDAIVEYIKELK